MSAREPIGDLLNSLGVTTGLRDDDMVTDAIVILKIVESDGSLRHSTLWSEGLGDDWLTRRGLIEYARDADRSGTERTS